MKNRIWNFICIVSLVLTFSSCSDFLDKKPDDMLTLEQVFEDKTRTEEWLASIYNQAVPNLFSEANFSYRGLSDDIFISPELQQYGMSFEINAMQVGSWNPSTKMSIDVWTSGYKAIRSAYIFINNVKALPSQGVTEEDAEFMRNEARFLIAYTYTRILSLHGPCPIVKSMVSSNASIEDLMQMRTPYDESVEWLDQELLKLSNYFPTTLKTEATQFGRPTKGICLAVRARLLLYAASPLFNGNPDFANVKNQDGTALISQSYDPNKWKKAADATKLLLDMVAEGAYSLYTEMNTNGTIDPFLSYQNLFLTTAQTNKEIIFARPLNASVVSNFIWVKRAYPRNMGGSGFISPPLGLVDEFFMKNGLPITDSNSGYSETGFTTAPISYNNTSYDLADATRTKGRVVATGVFNMYANREPRFYISIRYNNEYVVAYNAKTAFKYGEAGGRPNHDSPQCGHLPLKGISSSDYPTTPTYSPARPGIIMRLGEFYLNYAEALNEYNPGSTDILKYINLIRERAGIPQYGTDQGMITPPNSQDEMRKAIRKERRVELCLEGEIRYNDIRRWKIAEEIFSTPVMGMNANGTTNATFYQRTMVSQYKFNKKMYLWPINQTYIDNNPNLVQNPFWE